MAILYIANTTTQNHDFVYRIPAEGDMAQARVRMQKIVAGTQIRIHKDAPTAVLSEIIRQHAPYGLVPYDEITGTKQFIGLCFRFDKPIDMDRLLHAIEHNVGVHEKNDERQRHEAAVAVNQAIQESVGTPVDALEIETVEMVKPDATTGYAHGIEVVRDGAVSEKGGRRGSQSQQQRRSDPSRSLRRN